LTSCRQRNDTTRERATAGSRRLAMLSLIISMASGFALSGCGPLATAIPEVPMPELPVWMITPGSSLQVASVDPAGVHLASNFSTGIYALHEDHSITMVLFDGPRDNPRQAVTIRMFWRPRAGLTPLDATSTNATVRLMLFPDHEDQPIGIYEGAGFLQPRQLPGGTSMRAGLRQSNMRLVDASEGFTDLLGPAQLAGEFSVQRDDAAVPEAIRQLDQLVAQRLGYPRLVDADAEDSQRMSVRLR